jgi:hypothetical protein
MDADWEVEIGGSAPAIDALWPGFVDLRRFPARIAELAEAASFPPLAALLQRLNSASSPLWTSKCDVWEPEPAALAHPGEVSSSAPAALACYVDLLPVEGRVFARWQQAEALCRQWVARLSDDRLPECGVDLVVRLAIALPAEGFGVTAYLSASGADRPAAASALAALMTAFADAVLSAAPPASAVSKLQWKSTGE